MLALPALSRRVSRCRSPRFAAWRSRLMLAAVLGSAISVTAAHMPAAAAFGCLVLSNVSVPTVQAGERILFAADSGTVTAIIQIQYQGQPGDFGWLVPLPSIPKNRAGQDGIDVSTDEVFSKLLATTGPSYTINQTNACAPAFADGYGGGGSGGCNNGSFGGCNTNAVVGAAAPAGAGGEELPPMTAAPTPLVLQSSVGPYEFAVLKADSLADMQKWLQDNRYVVPTSSDAAISPYIRPGAYFLALKLKADASSGSIQPVVLRYQSDYPTIPVSLTSVGAVRNMGIQVWVLGNSRAIPRNYYHAVLNDAQLDLLGAVKNYSAVVSSAVAEAPGKHAFITEYAATSAVMVGQLDPPGRFAAVSQLATITDPYRYVETALTPATGFVSSVSPDGPGDSAFAVATILAQYIPEPQSLVQRGLPLVNYFQNLSYYLNRDPQRGGPDYDAVAQKLQAFDPAAVTAELQNRIVTPTLEAGKLFRAQPKLTRLYTTLSPEDMNLDPVFSYNPDLPDVLLSHSATLTQDCDPTIQTLTTDSGLAVSHWRPNNSLQPYSRRIESLGETGAPQIVLDQTSKIRSLAPFDSQSGPEAANADLQGGCITTPNRRVPVAGPVSLLVVVCGLLLRRRRRPAGADRANVGP